MPKTDIKKAALYIRVSTDMQADKDSLPLQESDLRKLADLNGIKETVLFKDAGFSGKNFNRPAFKDMIARIRQGEFTHLYVWKLDRISRNLLDFASMYDELKELGVIFVSRNEQFDTSTAMGEAMLKIILVFAELERKTTCERVTAVMYNRANEGKWNGGIIPLGYKSTGGKSFPVPDEEETKLVRIIFDKYTELKSMFAVCRYLADNGYRSRNNKIFTTAQISTFLSNPFYVGDYPYGNTIVKNTHEGIISRDTFDECQKIKQGNRKFGSKIGEHTYNQEKHIFGGLLFCAKCGYAYSCYYNIAGISSNYKCQRHTHPKTRCPASGGTSDKNLIPAILKYVSRIIYACKNPTEYDSPKQLQEFLLSDSIFPNAVAIEEIQDIYAMIVAHKKHVNLSFKVDKRQSEAAKLVIQAEKEKQKQEKYLTRLDDLFIFSASQMSLEDYTKRKQAIMQKIEAINQRINTLKQVHTDSNDFYIADAQKLLLIQKLADCNNSFVFRPLLETIGRPLMRELITKLIKKITMLSGAPVCITFANGITNTIKYKN